MDDIAGLIVFIGRVIGNIYPLFMVSSFITAIKESDRLFPGNGCEEAALEEAVGGYKRKPQKPEATREEILAELPVIEAPCTVPDKDRSCLYCNIPLYR